MRWMVILLTGLLLTSAARGATLHAILIRASNDQKLEDPQLRDLVPKLKKQFGYNYYKQLGAQKAVLKDNEPQNLNLGEGFVLFFTRKSREKNVHALDIEWTSGRASIVKSTVKIGENSHVFIKGPGVADDWILLALTVRDDH